MANNHNSTCRFDVLHKCCAVDDYGTRTHKHTVSVHCSAIECKVISK
jgi:hypothetical protein